MAFLIGRSSSCCASDTEHGLLDDPFTRIQLLTAVIVVLIVLAAQYIW